ncbi:MAG: hypothetical protein KAJ19_10510 [Gammaproteobacteria bacterium]|nr:hypothetical protein [Gammaproteobacteria bacterium]
MAQLDIQKVDKSGAALSYDAAAAAGDTFNSYKGVFVHAKKANAGDATITIAAITDPIITEKAGSLAVPDMVITVPTADDVLFSAPPSHIGPDGTVTMTYASETDLTLAVLVQDQ